MKTDPDAEATLIWLSRGETATVDSFTDDAVEPPPVANPEPWWTLADAVQHAVEVMRDHDKEPWIKTDGQIFGPSQILQVASALRAMGRFGA